MHNEFLVSILLRIGLAFVFIYAAISAFRQPEAWITYIPAFMGKLISLKLALDIVSVLQIVLALSLVSGKYLKYTALLAAALFGGIVLTNLGSLLITFRDVGLFFMALAASFLD